jgi:phage major head subunit gpT-like protein
MIDLTPNALENAILSLWNAIDESGKAIAVRPTRLLVPRKWLRIAIFVMHSKHKAHLMPFKQRKALKRAKARMHASFMTPRWAA